MLVLIAGAILALLVAGIRMGWLQPAELTRVAIWCCTGASAIAFVFVVRAFEQRGYSRSMLFLTAATVTVLGTSLVGLSSGVESLTLLVGKGSDTREAELPFDPPLSESSAERVFGQRLLWGVLALLGIAVLCASLALRHSGDLRRIDPGSEAFLDLAFGNRLAAPSTLGPLTTGACVLSTAPGWPNSKAAELVDCASPHNWQVLVIVGLSETCPTADIPGGARIEELVVEPDKICLVRFKQDHIGRIAPNGYLPETE